MNKAAVILSIALLLPVSSVFAETGVQTTVGVSLHGDAGEGQEHGDQATGEIHATLTAAPDEDSAGTTSDEVHTNASTTSSHEGTMSASHRSAVASFVQSLLRDASRDGGIGAKVRAVAQSQNDSASTTAAAIAHVEGRNAFLSFLIGTDWKNIGTLRSEIAKTTSDITALKTTIDQTNDAQLKADLEAQLTDLQAEQSKVQAFVDTHEKSFSLFGWFTKLFASGSITATTTASTTAQ